MQTPANAGDMHQTRRQSSHQHIDFIERGFANLDVTSACQCKTRNLLKKRTRTFIPDYAGTSRNCLEQSRKQSGGAEATPRNHALRSYAVV